MSNLFDNATAPKKIPKGFVKGDYVAWRLDQWVTDYAPADHTLTFNFRLEGDPAREFTVEGTTDADEYLFEISITESDALDAGSWHWDLYIVQDSDSKRITVDQGILKVWNNKAESSADPRTFPRKMLAEIERAILSRATNNQLDTLAYSLGVETSGTREPRVLTKWRRYFKAELIAANRQARKRLGLPHSGNIKVQF